MFFCPKKMYYLKSNVNNVFFGLKKHTHKNILPDIKCEQCGKKYDLQKGVLPQKQKAWIITFSSANAKIFDQIAWCSNLNHSFKLFDTAKGKQNPVKNIRSFSNCLCPHSLCVVAGGGLENMKQERGLQLASDSPTIWGLIGSCNELQVWSWVEYE